MIDRLVLDSGPLGMACHPHARGGRNQAFDRWLTRQMRAGVEICLPEIADYELRRELIRIRASGQIARLDRLLSTLVFWPLDRETMLLAADLWARARNAGIPTADARELDADVILAAQVQLHGGIVVTENVRHLSRFVDAREWTSVDLSPDDDNG